MKPLRHERRIAERWAARRAARARWWKLQEPIDSYGMRVWVDWARHLVQAQDDEPDEDIFASPRFQLQKWMRKEVRDGTMTPEEYFKSL